MTQRTQATALLGFAILGLLLLFASPLRAADPNPIACPNGQTIILQGRAPAHEALLIYLRGRPVGGGVADASGAYRLPLRAQERPGSYAVEVRLRSSRTVIERFTCFVDVPVAAISPTAGPTEGPATSTPGQRATATRAAVATSASTPSPSRTAPTPSPSGSPTITPTGPTATPTTTRTTGPSPSPTRTLQPGQPTPTITRTPRASPVQIIDIVLIDPAFPNSSEEYVQIRNLGDAPVTLTGWRLINASRPDATRSSVGAFVFPQYTLNLDVTVAIFSQLGEPDLELGDFYWNQPQEVWKAGDRAELRDAQNTLIHTFTVADQ